MKPNYNYPGPEFSESEICLECLVCCKYISMTWPYNGDRNLYKDWCAARGLKDLRFHGHIVTALIPNECPHLSPGGCDIYKNRPLACRIYDGRKDAALKRGQCKL